MTVVRHYHFRAIKLILSVDFKYLNFDKLPDFVATRKDVDLGKL